jgi:hypothetical protein
VLNRRQGRGIAASPTRLHIALQTWPVAKEKKKLVQINHHDHVIATRIGECVAQTFAMV